MMRSPDYPISRPPDLFWDVDTQADFMLPGGKLYAPGAEQIIPQLARLTQHARSRKILVVSSMDAHRPDDPEFTQWPPHCVVGTPGQQKIPETRLQRVRVVPPDPAEIPDDLEQAEQIIVEKRTVNVFTNPNLEKLLARLGRRTVTLYGVVTEVCVWLAGRDLLARGYPVRVVTDAIRPLNDQQGGKSLAELQRLGVQLITTADVLGHKPVESNQ